MVFISLYHLRCCKYLLYFVYVPQRVVDLGWHKWHVLLCVPETMPDRHSVGFCGAKHDNLSNGDNGAH